MVWREREKERENKNKKENEETSRVCVRGVFFFLYITVAAAIIVGNGKSVEEGRRAAYKCLKQTYTDCCRVAEYHCPSQHDFREKKKEAWRSVREFSALAPSLSSTTRGEEETFFLPSPRLPPLKFNILATSMQSNKRVNERQQTKDDRKEGIRYTIFKNRGQRRGNRRRIPSQKKCFQKQASVCVRGFFWCSVCISVEDRKALSLPPSPFYCFTTFFQSKFGPSYRLLDSCLYMLLPR